jgi:hypothetical protein
MSRTLSILALGLLFATLPAAAQTGGKQVALIIGNNAYSISPLQNAVNDARIIDKALRDSGFRTILKENATKAAMEEAISDFLQQLGPDDTALFFYAGHGIQIENENFLVPIDFTQADSVIQAKFRCFSMAQIFAELKSRPKRSIVILDACRSNPVATSNRLQAGLAQPQTTGAETFVAYSTSPGQVAADNPNGRNSWFSESLADMIAQPGLTIDDVFTRVKKRVSEATDGKQTPWTTSSLTGRFFFHPPDNASAENDPTAAEKWLEDARAREQRKDWDAAIELINRILAKKPGGALQALATAKLPYLSARRDAQARYEANDFAGAAARYEAALQLDPFAIDAAFEGANSYMLADKLPDALRLLHSIRVRGASASIDKTKLYLTELAPALPEADAELKASTPPPPPIDEVFRGLTFGTPDFDAAQRYLQSTSVDVSKSVRDLTAAYPPPPAVVPVTVGVLTDQGPAPAVDNTPGVHIYIVPTTATRDLVIRRVADARPPSETGFVQLQGDEAEDPVSLNGKLVAPRIPVKLQVPVGQYEIRVVKDGQVSSTQTVNVTVNNVNPVVVQK